MQTIQVSKSVVKFQKYYVTDGTVKVKVHYSVDNRTDARKSVTIYAREYDYNLGKLFPGHYHNNTEIETDYFEKGHVVLFEDHPLYAEARKRAEQTNTEDRKRYSTWHIIKATIAGRTFKWSYRSAHGAAKKAEKLKALGYENVEVKEEINA